MSRRVPDSFLPNPLAAALDAKRREGRRVLDLAGSDPSRAGLGGDASALASILSRPGSLDHEPDPRGLLAARAAVAEYLGRRADRSLSPERVFLTASTSEAYAHLFRLLCEPGDEVLVPRPSYPLLEPLARLENARIHSYHLVYADGWRLDLDSFEGSVGPKTRAVVVVEPNNPTGSRLTDEAFRQVEALCVDRGLPLIVDEVFGDISWPPATGPLPSRIGGRTAPAFVLGGLSKSCGLPQLKLGWIAADGPDAALERLLPGLEWILDLFLSVGTPVQAAVPELLAARHPFQRALRERIEENLRALDRAAARSEGALERYRGEGGTSAIVRLDPRGMERGRELATWALEERDIYAHPAHFYDLDRDDLLVVSLITPPSLLEEALERLLAS
jgi:alanine-synthesizing transaminase